MALPKPQELQYQQSSPLEAFEQRLSELESTVGWRKRSVDGLFIPPPPTPSRDVATLCASSGSPGQQNPRSTAAAIPISGRARSINSVTHVIRNMHVGCLGGCVGATSEITMGRIINSMMKVHEISMVEDSKSSMNSDSRHTDKTSSSATINVDDGESCDFEDHLSPKSASVAASVGSAEKTTVELGAVPDDIANKLFRAYIYHISTRWPALHSPYLRHLHSKRAALTDIYDITVLHMVYAIGGRFLETAGERGAFCSDQHCEEATKNLDLIIAHRHGLQPIRIIAMFAIYNLRSPKGLGAWTYTGLAMRQCIEQGLHRPPPTHLPLLEREMRRRLFWTCYCLDRQVSIILGRPFAISDRDIDVELPLDIDELVEDEGVLQAKMAEIRGQSVMTPPAKSTTMTAFIYICRLRRIESAIQQTIYRVDKQKPAAALMQDVDAFRARLDKWKAAMPLDARDLPNFDLLMVDGYNNYMIYYYKCITFLLHPVIASAELADSRSLKECAEACGGVCRTYKTIHQHVPVGFSIMALHSIFIAGLTMLYCVWSAPREVFKISTSRDIEACSIVLYIIAERWVGARKYRDIFEAVKEAVLEAIERGANEPRCPIVTSLRPGAREALNTVVAGAGLVASQGEFSAMLDDMIGQSMPSLQTGSADHVVGDKDGEDNGDDEKSAHVPHSSIVGSVPDSHNSVLGGSTIQASIPGWNSPGQGPTACSGSYSDGQQQQRQRRYGTSSDTGSTGAYVVGSHGHGSSSDMGSNSVGAGITSSYAGGIRDGGVDFMFPLDNVALDALTMDFAVPGSMGLLMDGLGDGSQTGWDLRRP